MAVTFDVESTRSSVYFFAPEDITIKPELNGRHDLPDIEWLIADIARRGQVVPVSIRKDGGKPVLVAGHSRWRACVEINKRHLTSVPVKLACTYFMGNERDGFMASISENRFRNTTTPMDDSYNIGKLMKWGQAEKDIATIYFPNQTAEEAKKNVAWVKSRAKLLNLSPEVQDAVSAGTVKPTAAAHLATLSAEQQRKAMKGEKPTKIKSKRPSHKELVLWIEQHQNDREESEEVKDFCTILLAFMRGEPAE
jgi:ParB-like chromosome segregation protein Spo0J